MVAWFGFVPAFHDATLAQVGIGDDAVTWLNAFRMTSAIDAAGYFVLDRHAVVSIHLTGVTGVRLAGGASSILSDLGIRRMGSAPVYWDMGSSAPAVDDYELVFDACHGMEGAIIARAISLSFAPAAA